MVRFEFLGDFFHFSPDNLEAWTRGHDRPANIKNASFPSVFMVLYGTVNSMDDTVAELLGSLEQSRIKEANLRAVGHNLSISRELTVKRVLASAVWEPVKNNQFQRNSYTDFLPFIFTMIDSLNSHSQRIYFSL